MASLPVSQSIVPRGTDNDKITGVGGDASGIHGQRTKQKKNWTTEAQRTQRKTKGNEKTRSVRGWLVLRAASIDGRRYNAVDQ